MFTLTTPEGIKMEIDPTKVEGFVVEVLGKKYEIIIHELKD